MSLYRTFCRQIGRRAPRCLALRSFCRTSWKHEAVVGFCRQAAGVYASSCSRRDYVLPSPGPFFSSRSASCHASPSDWFRLNLLRRISVTLRKKKIVNTGPGGMPRHRRAIFRCATTDYAPFLARPIAPNRGHFVGSRATPVARISFDR